MMRKGFHARHAGGMLIGALVVALSACTQGEVSSANASGDPAGGNGQVPISNGQALQGQVALGKIAGSHIEVFDSRDLSTPIATTQADRNFVRAGQFELPSTLFDSDRVYLLVASGGHDLDPDSNDLQDTHSEPFTGRLHTVATGADLLQSNFGITAATEALYRRALYLLAADMPATNIIAELDARSRALFAGSQGNRLTALRWRPAAADALRDGVDKLRAFEAALYAGSSDNTLAFELTDAIHARMEFEGNFTLLAANERVLALSDDTDGERRLVLVSLLEPNNPQLISTNYRWHSRLVAGIHGRTLYVMERFRNFGTPPLYALDITDPFNLEARWHNDIVASSSLLIPGGEESVYVVSDDAVIYVEYGSQVAGQEGLIAPVGEAGAAGDDGVVYLASGNKVLSLIPQGFGYTQHLSEVSPLLQTSDMAVANGRLFASSFSGLTEFELSTPSQPRVIQHYPALRGQLRVLPEGRLMVGARIIDISQPGAAVIPTAQAASLSLFTTEFDLLVGDNRVLVEHTPTGKRISLADPSLQFPLHAQPAIQLPSVISDLVIDNNRVAVAAMDGIRLYKPGQHSPLDFLGFSTEAVHRFRRISVCGNRVSSLGVTDDFFQMLDISDPTSPVAGGHKTPELSEGSFYFRHSFCDGTVFYFNVIDFNQPNNSIFRLHSYEVTQVNNPLQLSDVDLERLTHFIGRTERYAYAPAGEGMQVIDLSNPGAPYISTWEGPIPAESGAYAYHFSATGSTGFLKFNSAELLQLTLGTHGFPTSSQSKQVEMFRFGRYLPITEDQGYLAAGGLAAVDFTSARPTPMLDLDLEGYDVELLGDQLLIRASNRLLTVPLIQREVP